jgi:hypothetical protein
MIQFSESKLLFEFTDDWSDVMKYDEEVDYKKINDAVPETKAVDFMGVLQNDKLFFFEVKNFRKKDRANGDTENDETKERLERENHNSLTIEIAQKIRDTLSGILNSARHSTNKKETWKKYLSLIQNEKKPIYVVVWVENDRLSTRPDVFNRRRDARNGTIEQRLKKRLAWLTTRVSIMNLQNNEIDTFLKVKEDN